MPKKPPVHSRINARLSFTVTAPAGESHNARVLQRLVEKLEACQQMGVTSQWVVQAMYNQVEREMRADESMGMIHASHPPRQAPVSYPASPHAIEQRSTVNGVQESSAQTMATEAPLPVEVSGNNVDVRQKLPSGIASVMGD